MSPHYLDAMYSSYGESSRDGLGDGGVETLGDGARPEGFDTLGEEGLEKVVGDAGSYLTTSGAAGAAVAEAPPPLKATLADDAVWACLSRAAAAADAASAAAAAEAVAAAAVEKNPRSFLETPGRSFESGEWERA